jgi:hypothetical protein
MTRRQIDDGSRNEERRYLARAALQEIVVFTFDYVKTPDARCDVDADARTVFRLHFESGNPHGLIGAASAK